jgi:hypothetical protein
VNNADLAHWRMSNLRLVGPPFDAPEDVVRWLCAVQSQDYGPAKWAVGSRAIGATDASMDQAFADGAILRTHVLRPTWHFVLPEDIRWLLEATAPRVQVANRYMYRRLGLDEVVRGRCNELIVGALRGGNQLTRKELKSVLERAGISTEGFRLGYIMANAELNQIICSGALRGKQHTYALVDERAPRAKRMTFDEAVGELVRRYFTSFGPATTKDLKAWSSLTMTDIKRGLDVVGSELEHEVIGGLEFWFVQPPPRSRPASPSVHLLQAYDEYVMGYRESRFVLDASAADGVRTPVELLFNLIVLLDGRVAGSWKRTVKRDSVVIEAALFAPFDDSQSEALQAAAERYGEFLGVTATVEQTQL